MKYIFSFDGGGVKGVLIACALQSLERQTGRLCRDICSFAAGTSTGALIASAIAAGVPAARIVEIYTQRAREIFTPSEPLATLERVAKGYMYDSRNIARVLESEFGQAASWALNNSPIKLLLTAKGIDLKPWYFVPDCAQNAAKVGGLNIVECATASASAPTYFTPTVVNILGKPTTLVDGGVGVTGCPAYEACVEAFAYDAYDPAQTRVISFGTGSTQPGSSTPCGLIGWLSWTINSLLDAPEKQQIELVNAEWPGILTRLNPDLPKPVDMADVSAIPDLEKIGERFAQTIDWGKIL